MIYEYHVIFEKMENADEVPEYYIGGRILGG